MTFGDAGPVRSVEGTIRALRERWRGLGCVDLPPCAFEVPLPILHPQTFFRLLDDDPWRAACLQTVTRPADARSGRHPVRASRHLQLHVVLRDAPSSALRGWLLDSLGDLGIRSATHELRLDSERRRIEALDADGVGWRVLVDGLAVAGVTVWRRFAGRELERPAVGLGFVVERLALVAAELDDIFRLRWSELASEAAGSGEDGGDTSYASFRRRAEEEAGRYADDVASVEQIRRRIDDLESEARRCLDAGLLRPAYERAVQTLVPLDLLARRGELEPLERRRWLDEIRRLVVAVADAARSEAVSSESVSSETVSSGAVASGAVSSEEMPSEEVRSEAVSSEEMHSEAERSKVEEPADDEAESPEEAAIDQDSELADPAAEDDDA